MTKETGLERELAVKLGNRLRELRIQADYTQEAFAERLGISYKHYQDIETARHSNPTIKTLYGASKALGMALPDLIEGVFPPPN